MRTIIAGSRSISDRAILDRAIAESGFQITTVLSGAARGVDRLGEQWAKDHNVTLELYPANWDAFGKGAGLVRNTEMLGKAGKAGGLLAIWDGVSSGTRDMIAKAKRAGLCVFIYYAH